MPVIRGGAASTVALDPKLRKSLLAKLKSEIDGSNTERGPVVFEIPLDGVESIDVLVVWEDEDWAKVRSEDRTNLILEAYGDKPHGYIAQALGVTYQEAIQQQLLPYAVVSALEQNRKMLSLVCGDNKNKADALLEEIRKAKRDNGGILLANNIVDLRFPTRAMADDVHQRLFERHRDFYWSVIYPVASVPDNL
jgi:hypothetical protein